MMRSSANHAALAHCQRPHELVSSGESGRQLKDDLSAHENGLASDTDHKRRSAETETQPRSELTRGSVSVAATTRQNGRRWARPTVCHDALLAQDLIHHPDKPDGVFYAWRRTP